MSPYTAIFSPAFLRDLEINDTYISEEMFLEVLTERVAAMLDNKLDFFLSLLYRLDVAEADIKRVLSGGENNVDPPRALAKLILERQKNRLATREKYKSRSSEEE